MPPHAAFSNSLPFHSVRVFTASAALSLALVLVPEASHGSRLDTLAENMGSLPSLTALPTPEIAGEANPSYVIAGEQPTTLAQMPPNATYQAGVSVPWNGAQPLPMVPQGVAAGMPPQASAPGSWTMVWMPYAIPLQASPGGSPAQTSQAMTVYLPAWAYMGPASGSVPQGTYPQATLPPGAYPPIMPPQAFSPVGYPPGMAQYPGSFGIPPQGVSPGISPHGGMPFAGHSYAPSPYGSPPAGNPAPTQPFVQPYALASPTATQPPLVVPTLPSTPNNGSQGLPSPPAFNQPYATPFSAPQPSVPLNLGATTNLPGATTGAPPGGGPPPMAAVPAPRSTDVALTGPITPPNLDLQGLYVLQGDNSSARARLSGEAFLTPNLLVGGALDLVTGPDLTNDDGVDLTELYLAASVPGAPGLRFRLGQLDLTSYFDRNSFAKDIGRDFFNSTFHTNPALISGANATASRPGGLVQWAVTDDIALNAAVFSSSSDITDFALDGFAGEVGFRTGNLIVRGTFLTARDRQFQGSGGRLDSYGVNAEWFIPEVNIGLFGRYGHLNNDGTGFSGDTYSFGLNALDVFMENDRLGVGYGRNLETTVAEFETPDVLELFYDFEITPNIRLGFTFQQRDQLRESYAGFRVRGDLDLFSRGSGE